MIVLPEEWRPPICDSRAYESNHRGYRLCLLKTQQIVDNVTFQGAAEVLVNFQAVFL
jgi:hypothetical protein